jgi:cytochrome c-type biogenesis protein CcmH
MLLWLVCAVLSAAVLAFVLRPLWDGVSTRSDGDSSAVYRDQLTEIAADRERGLIDAAEAEAARIEVARRLLATDPDGSPSKGATTEIPPRSSRAQRLALALGIVVPLATALTYWLVGSPRLPDQPLAARMKAPLETADPGRLVAAVEARLAQHPDDGQGWDVIAPVYLRGGAFAKAVEAYSRAIKLLGETPKRLAGFAEASVLANDGQVTDVAREAWAKLARLEPERPEPRFWLAVAEEQAGRLAEAIAGYRALLASAPADASWRPLVEERITAAEARRVGGTPDATARSPASKGPSEADVAAADKLSPADRQRMIEGMVEGLAARLAKDGRDLEGWQRLIRAYTVLGRREQALAALKSARGAFEKEPQSLSTLAELARALGLET